MSDTKLEVHLDLPRDAAIERVTAALAAEGFGVLTRIDLDEAFRNKLGVEFRSYTVLGACQPQLAHRAVVANPEVGLLLPCNITVEADGMGSRIRIVDPSLLLTVGGMDKNPEIAAVGREATERLQRVVAALRP